MIEVIGKKLYNNNKLVDLDGLNSSHIIWHLQEMYRPEKFLENLNGKYTMPDKINHMSLAEGIDFDALLVDDKLFRITKLKEEDKSEVQDYINKYAYATALLKLTECSKVMGSGLKHNFTMNESYTFISKSYNKLFENVYSTKEMGKLVEGFGTDNKLSIYEGVNTYIRDIGNKRIVENWKNVFNHNNISEYYFEEVSQKGNSSVLKFIDNNGVVMEAVYEDTSAKLLEAGINLSSLLNKSKLVESYRVNTLNEYHKPFTITDATILSYETAGDKLKLVMLDAYGNKGELYLSLNIPVKQFIKKYKRDMDKIVTSKSFSDEGVVSTSEFLNKAEGDIKSIPRIKNREIIASDDKSSFLPYQVSGLVPDTTQEGEIIYVDPKDKTKFKVSVLKNGEPYNITYTYKGNNIYSDITDIQNEVDDYDFNTKSDVINFFKLIGDIGTNPRTYKRGISTAGRNYQNRKKVEGEMMEAEGVQTTDIAPKLDQEVGSLIKVKMKKKKKVTESDMFDINDLLVESISEKDAFYGARGFIKDENGRYHFGDYYLTESGKVVHKSKLKESSYEDKKTKQIEMTKDIAKKVADKVGNVNDIDAQPIWRSRGYCISGMSLDDNTVRLQVVCYFNKDAKGKIRIEVSPNFKGCNQNNGYYAWSYYNSVDKAVEGAYKAVGIAREIVNAVKANDNEKIKELSTKLKSMNQQIYESADERKIRTAHNLAKMYDVDRKTALNNIHFPKDIQNIKKHGGAGHYNKNEWKDLKEYNQFSPTPEDWDDINHWYNDDPREEWDKKAVVKGFIISVNGSNPVKYSPKDMSVEEAIKDYLENEGSGYSKADIDVEYINESSTIKEGYGDRYRTLDEMIKLFKDYSSKYGVKAHREDSRYFQGIADGYEGAAFELEHNLDPEKHKLNESADSEKVISDFKNSGKSTEEFTKALNDISRMEWENEISREEYENCIKQIQDIFKDRNRINESEDADGYTNKYRCVTAGYNEVKTFDTKEEAIEYAKSDKTVYSVMPVLYKNGKLERIGLYDVWCREDINESFDPRGYTKAIEAISAGIETDEDKEALQKYLQDIIGFCRSIAEDYGVLVEGQQEADDAYYKVNKVTQELIKIKSIIEGNKEAEDKYSSIIRELNDLQMYVYKKKLNESDLVDPVLYAQDVLSKKEPQTEFDKLCVEYNDIFLRMCDYNTIASDIYPGFDKENAESYLSPEDYKKFKKYDDLYQSEREKLRQVSDKIDAIPDEEVGEMAMQYKKDSDEERKNRPNLWDNPQAAYNSKSVK